MSTYNPTFRGTQNPETPNLPFGQVATTSYQGIAYSIQPDRAPFSLWQQVSKGRSVPKFDYVLNGTSTWYCDFKDKRIRMPESLANMYRGIGYKVVKVSQPITPELPAGTGKATKAQILSIVRDEYGDDITLLHENSVKLGNALTAAQVHRKEIESLVGNSVLEHDEFHTKLKYLGTSVSDVSTALEAHKIGHNGGLFGLPSMTTLLIIGGVAFLALRKKR